jgi:hypothetical protein
MAAWNSFAASSDRNRRLYVCDSPAASCPTNVSDFFDCDALRPE